MSISSNRDYCPTCGGMRRYTFKVGDAWCSCHRPRPTLVRDTDAEPSPLVLAAETLLAVIGDYEGEGAQADAKAAVAALRAAVDAARGRA